MLRTAVSLAVAAVPEGLPTLATTTLALGIEDLRRRGVLIRRLEEVEGLSALQVICFDKKGTLTRGSMSVEQVARSEEHTSELQSLMRISYAVYGSKKNN